MIATTEPAEVCETDGGGGRRRLLWALLIVLVLATPAILYLIRENWVKKSDPATLLAITNHENSLVQSSDGETRSPLPKAPKSIADLKVGAITLEKAKGSSLVYAVGTLRNHSDHQRFGVNLEVELADARGNKAGIAKDYRPVIEPRQEWRFRALVLDPKAASAKLSVIREED